MSLRLRATTRNFVAIMCIIQVQSERVCETGMDEPEPEIHWKLDAEQVGGL